jgi:hypothetical protein
VTTTTKLGTILWSSYLIYKTLSYRAIYLSALKSYQKTLSYTVVVPYSRVLSYIPIYSVYWIWLTENLSRADRCHNMQNYCYFGMGLGKGLSDIKRYPERRGQKQDEPRKESAH